jgi:beta-phosphoglucomutase-like phosphatase (HAD superfamily)
MGIEARDVLRSEGDAIEWHEYPMAHGACGEDVERKKPDPEVYLRAVTALGLSPHRVLAIEDSPDGATAASAAGVPVIVARSAYFAGTPIAGALTIGPGLHERQGWQPTLRVKHDSMSTVGLADLEAWCLLTQSAAQSRVEASGAGKDAERGQGD